MYFGSRWYFVIGIFGSRRYFRNSMIFSVVVGSQLSVIVKRPNR